MSSLFEDAVEQGTLAADEAGPGPYVRPSLAEILAVPVRVRAVGSFSGCGGSSLGLRAAGIKVEYAIEFIGSAADTYEANFPETYVDRRDIRKVQATEILERMGLEPGELDLFEGSPPCASFSSAGMRERGWGEEKKYSETRQRTDDLFEEWLRLLRDLRPRAFIAENVPGMLNGAALEEYAFKVTARLGSLGYHVHADVHNSCNYGVPQDRRRLIFVGLRRDVADGPIVWPAPTTPEPHTLRQALASVEAQDAPDDLADSSMEGKAVGRTWEWKRGLREKDDCARCGRPLSEHSRHAKTVGSVKKTAGASEGDTRETTFIICADGKKGIEVKDYFLLTVPELDRPCPTLTATGSSVGAASVVHPTECRKFTPAEAKAIGGFPADFVLTGSREQRYERMGRTVTPPLYAAIGGAIAEALTDD